jgi:hypothetical protein
VRGRGVFLAVLAAALLAGSSGSAAVRDAAPGIYTGYGFDACTAPSTSALDAWAASPYRALGIYLGGVNRACGDGNLSAGWVSSTLAQGWDLLPLYVGLQAPCVGNTKLARISTSASTATSQGSAAADDAAARAASFGLPVGSPVYFDMEGYKVGDAQCTKAVQSFVTGWVSRLRALGLLPGVYGSAASTIRDVSSLGTATPDAAWIANWNGVESVFGDPYVSDSLWPNHQRVHQYKGGHKETWGGVTINIDSNVVDGPVVAAAAAPAPPPAIPPSGSVGSGDNRATAAWPDGAFPSSAVVTLTPVSPQPAPPSGYAVQLTVTDSQTSAPVARFTEPVTVHLLTPANGLVPSWSVDGVTWKPVHPVADLVDPGYTLDADGTVEIQTLVPGFFALLPDTIPPTQPPGFAARFSHGALTLSWQAATDNSGLVAAYEVLLDGSPVTTVPAKSRRAVVRAFHPAGKTVYRVRAVDAQGNVGKPTRPVVVVPTVRPAGLPRVLPHWVWPLFDYQHHRGPRPAAAPRKPPAWYWRWAAWRAAPFHLLRT